MRIFLSYRRADSAHALWLYPSLIRWFGRERVFWDRKDIEPGADFTRVIEDQIRASGAFVAIVSDNWLSAVDEEGHRRIDAAEDWIRRETSIALREGCLVIPVLVSGMKPPGEADLPGDLRKFAQLQMLSAAHISFHDLLRERLESVIPAAHPAPGPAGEQGGRLQRRAGNLLKRQIQRLQVRAAELIQDGRLDRAAEEVSEGSELLMALLDFLPGDPMLDAELGYLFGTTSQSFERAGKAAMAFEYRELARSVFERLKANPALPLDVKVSAINGIGGAHYAGGHPAAAIPYHRAAVAMDPQYCYAWHDLFASYDVLAQRGAINLAGMREAIDRARETGLGKPGLGNDKFEFLERRFDHWQVHLAREPHREVRDGEFRIVPQFLALVIAEADPLKPIFNLNCDIMHLLAHGVNLQGVDVEVSVPGGRKTRFDWNVFYDFRPSVAPWNQRMTSLGAAHEILVEPGGTSLGVQFVSQEAGSGLLWQPGRYKFELRGRTNKQSGDPQVDARTSFSIRIDNSTAGDAHQWSRAGKAAWDRLGDPDRAIGIPVVIHRATRATVA